MTAKPGWTTSVDNKGERHWHSPKKAARTVVIDYTNWRGERRNRRVTPRGISFCSTEWHPEPQWVMLATDEDTGEDRQFAMRDIHSWRAVNPLCGND